MVKCCENIYHSFSSKVYHNVEVSDPSHARPVAGMGGASRGLRPFGISCPPRFAGMERCDVDLVVVDLSRFRCSACRVSKSNVRGYSLYDVGTQAGGDVKEYPKFEDK